MRRLFFPVLVRSMRIASTLLLLGGFLLCISIVWAALGFPMIGLGLIGLLIAERRKKQSTALARALAGEVDRRREPSLPIENAPSAVSVELPPSGIGPQQAPLSLPEPRQPRPPKPALILQMEQAYERRNEPDTNPYDLEKWSALVKSDADVSRSVEALQPFGKKYVDQLATAYLAFEEKSYLPVIVNLVARAIKKDSGRDSADVAAIDNNPNTDLISFALSKSRTSVAEQVLASDARVKEAAVRSELKTSRTRPEGGARSAKRQPDAKGVDMGLAVRAAGPARKATESADDSQDLTDLLNRIA
jgi:hypothetical protein